MVEYPGQLNITGIFKIVTGNYGISLKVSIEQKQTVVPMVSLNGTDSTFSWF